MILALLCTDIVTSGQDHQSRSTDSPTEPYPLQPQHHSPCILPEPSTGEDTGCPGSPPSARMLAEDLHSGSSHSSSPGLVRDHILEYLDSEPEHDGIFLEFSQHCSEESLHRRDGSRQSVAWHATIPPALCRPLLFFGHTFIGDFKLNYFLCNSHYIQISYLTSLTVKHLLMIIFICSSHHFTSADATDVLFHWIH